MEHLEWHNHAYIDENNIVIAISVFQETDHDSQLLEDIKNLHNAKQTVCCCTFGMAKIGDTWVEELSCFKSPQYFPSWTWSNSEKDWIPPIQMPTDGKKYLWDEADQTWVINPFPINPSSNGPVS